MVIGSERMRRPVAWYTALARAADTPDQVEELPQRVEQGHGCPAAAATFAR